MVSSSTTVETKTPQVCFEQTCLSVVTEAVCCHSNKKMHATILGANFFSSVFTSLHFKKKKKKKESGIVNRVFKKKNFMNHSF